MKPEGTKGVRGNYGTGNEASCSTQRRIYPQITQITQIYIQTRFTLATDNDKMTEARTYVGVSLGLVGRRDDARSHLEWVVKNGNREFIEYTLSQAELRRISSAR